MSIALWILCFAVSFCITTWIIVLYFTYKERVKDCISLLKSEQYILVSRKNPLDTISTKCSKEMVDAYTPIVHLIKEGNNAIDNVNEILNTKP